MENLHYEIQINAPRERVWHVLTNKKDFKNWSKAFSPNSDYRGEWKEGAEIEFIDEGRGGTVARLDKFQPHSIMVASHIATLTKEGKRETTGPFTENWIGTQEIYRLEEAAGKTLLKIEMLAHKDFTQMFVDSWPQALKAIKEISESPECHAGRKANPVGWFEIYVQDMKRAKAFYEKVFQTKLESLVPPETDQTAGIEMFAFPGGMETYGAPGALAKMPGFTPGNNSVLIYFSCEDCAVEEARVVESGGKVEKSKLSIGPYGFIALVYDTEGNMIGLHSMR